MGADMDDVGSLGGAASIGTHEAHEVFEVEQRGIDHIPPGDRTGIPLDLFWMWLGTITNIFPMIYGAILILFVGLSFGQAVLIIVIGNVISFPLLGLASLQGPATGTSTFVISRAAFGPNGNRIVALFNWLTMIGFETANLVLVVLAGFALLGEAGVEESDWLRVVLILVACAIQLPLPLYGHATVLRALKVLSYLFVALTAILAALIIPDMDAGALSQSASWPALSGALALIIVGGGLSWANYGNDYSRYLPADSDKRALFLWPTLGGMLPTIVLEVLGAAVATITPNASDLVSGLPEALPSWFLVPYLLTFIVQLFAVNTVDLYTSGLSLQAMGVPLRRWVAVVVDLVITTILLFFVVFSDRFNELLLDFLLLQLLWLAPWVAIYLVDWWLRRGVYDPASLLADPGRGIYWRNGGIHVPGVAALVVGIIAGASWVNLSVYTGPLSTRSDGSDFSVFLGVFFGGLVYYLMGRAGVTREAKATLVATERVVPSP
jgi:nucleobase:cation symporter-1, NCS1 family